MNITTNNVPRPVIEGWELTDKERQEFDYLDWSAIDQGEDSASFLRYRGRLYDLHEFDRVSGGYFDGVLEGWDGILTDSFFSAVVVRYVLDNPDYSDHEYVVVGTVYA